MPFDDTDVYKIIEGASNSLISAPDPRLEALLDTLIDIIEIGQEADGYLTTWRTIDPAHPPATWIKVIEGKRWESLEMSHELYNAGHLYEAAAVHHLATGKRNFLDIALKNANLMVATFGPGKIETVPGHQIIETGLIKLYRITGNTEYLDLARFFMDGRGTYTNERTSFGPYAQDHLPVTQQAEVVGHAVRAMYLYAGMTDIAALEHDADYLRAIEQLWTNMVGKKIYITGGIGARHSGESFGDNYELPNLTAYNETCAAIGSAYWNHRLFQLSGSVEYYDVIERTLYNGLISGLALDGKHFFYPNALESDGKYTFNQGACTRKDWFDCSCCPTNMIRFLPAVPGLIYAHKQDTIFVNLYAASEATIELPQGEVKISQQTAYPLNGRIELEVEVQNAGALVLKCRIPGWARNSVLPGDLYHYANAKDNSIEASMNGEMIKVMDQETYLIIDEFPDQKSTINLNFPMSPRLVQARREVAEDRGKAAIEYGPLVYAFEEVDNPGKMDELVFSDDSRFSIRYQPKLLGGVNQLICQSVDLEFTGVPYYAWSNRGIGQMKVWLPYEKF
jgi:DUF1680 family protein